MQKSMEAVLAKLKTLGEKEVYVDEENGLVYKQLGHRYLDATFKTVLNSDVKIKWDIAFHVEFTPNYKEMFLNKCVYFEDFN